MADHGQWGPTVDPQERRQRGLRLYREVMAVDAPTPDSAHTVALIDFVFAEIWSRPALGRRERRFVALACACAAGNESVMADHFYGALASGDLSLPELQEFVLHFAVYCGWPKGTAAEGVLRRQWERVHAERGEVAPPWPPVDPPAGLIDPDERFSGGEQEFVDTNFVPAPPRDVPYYGNGILNFVFGMMWKRPGLSRRDRRFITLGCVGLDDTVGPINSHVYSAMKSGDISFTEMREVVLQFAAHSGWPKASYLQQVTDEQHTRVLAEAAAG